MFEEEISPEELFRQFFGGGGGFGGFGGGGPFGGMGGGGMGGPFVFNMGGGGPGVRVHRMGGGNPRRRPHNHADARPASPMETVRSMLPLLLLVLLPLLSSLFGGDKPTGPSLRFDNPIPPHTQAHTLTGLKMDYYVKPEDVHGYTSRQWKDLDKVAERKYVGQLSSDCEWEQSKRQQIANEAQGFFFTDQVMLDRARRMEMPSCRRLQEVRGGRPWY